MRDAIEEVLIPYWPTFGRISTGDIHDKDEILNGLKKMIETVYEGVHWPCSEMTELVDLITLFYDRTGNVSKMLYLHKP